MQASIRACRVKFGCPVLQRSRRLSDSWLRLALADTEIVAARPGPDDSTMSYYGGMKTIRKVDIGSWDRARSVPERAGNRGVSRSARETPKPA